jgi:hypothetical protein
VAADRASASRSHRATTPKKAKGNLPARFHQGPRVQYADDAADGRGPPASTEAPPTRRSMARSSRSTTTSRATAIGVGMN